MSLCNDCWLPNCDSRCPYEIRERRLAARCKVCGTNIYEGEDALVVSKILPIESGYVCIDCVHEAIKELYLDNMIGD